MAITLDKLSTARVIASGMENHNCSRYVFQEFLRWKHGRKLFWKNKITLTDINYSDPKISFLRDIMKADEYSTIFNHYKIPLSSELRILIGITRTFAILYPEEEEKCYYTIVSNYLEVFENL